MLLARTLVLASALTVLSCLPNSLESDAKLGARTAERLELNLALANDSFHAAYLQKVGDRLESFLPPHPVDFQFRLVDSTKPDAFSLPGGFVYISRGLLAAANSEDELAGVIAHEMIHIMERHGVRKAKRARSAQALKIPGRVADAVLGGELGNFVSSPVKLITGLNLARYSRSFEQEADFKGMELMARAGYVPQALLTFLLKMSLINSVVEGKPEEPSLFSSHPYTPSRAIAGMKFAEGVTAQTSNPVATDYLRVIDGLPHGEDPSQGIWRNGEFLSPRAGIALSFPPTWNPTQLGDDLLVMHPQGSAFLMLSQGTTDANPSEIGMQFAAAVRTRFGQDPTLATTVSIGDYPAYLVSLDDTSGESAVSLHFLWVQAGKETTHFMAMGTKEHERELGAAVRTIRPLAAVEYQGITREVISSAPSRAGEFLAEFGFRTGNGWEPDVTAAMNGLDPDDPLIGQRIKILARRPLQ